MGRTRGRKAATPAPLQGEPQKLLYATHGDRDGSEPTTVRLYRDKNAKHLVGDHPLSKAKRPDYIFVPLWARWVELEWID